MKLRLFKPSDMRSMPWKNGGGTTSEVRISPTDAELATLNFDWRVSIADVASDGPFSLFPGFDRQLVVWKGEGLKINGAEKRALAIFELKGEDEITATLIAGAIRDFGIIFNRTRVQSAMSVKSLSEDEVFTLFLKDEPRAENSVKTTSKSETHAGNAALINSFILCTRGELRIGEFYLNPGDVLQAEGEGGLAITALERSDLVSIRIKT